MHGRLARADIREPRRPLERGLNAPPPAAAAPREVVVCGAGMAGLAAAAAALEAGASVVVLEKGYAVGGSLAMSGGLLWTFPTADGAWAEAPLGNPALQALVVERFPAAVQWLVGLGVALQGEVRVGVGRGHLVDPADVVAALFRRIARLGGAVRTETALDRLVTRAGAVVGVQAVTSDGTAVDVAADAVVVATGGFQGNAELVQRYLAVPPDHVYLRANPWSTGDGLLAALDAGAAASAGMDGFYGHAMAAPPATVGADRFRDATQYYGHLAVALDLRGERFADESAGSGEEGLNQRVARCPGGLAFYVLDDASADQWLFGGRLHVRALVARAAELGAPHVRAASLAELCAGLERFGVPARRALATLERYNDDVRAGATAHPSRRTHRAPLARPPFHAVGVKASITFTTGGLLVDGCARVLRRSSSSSPLATLVTAVDDYRPVPVPGLLAAGNDVGGVHHGGYLGGLAAALTTGITAGRTAANPGTTA